MTKVKGSSKNVALGSTALNILFFIVKAVLAIQIASLALLTDSIHTLTDSVSSIGVYLGLRLSDKPPDEMHPYGHGRAEHVAILLVGLLLIMTALKFLSDGVFALIYGTSYFFVSRTVMLIVGGTAVVKFGMWGWSYVVGTRENTVSLQADAWHHLSDVFTTIVVIIALWGANKGYHYLDAFVGIGIALFIIYFGLSYSKRSIDNLLGSAPSETLVEKIKERAGSFEGVKEVHGIKVHDYGRRSAISLHMRPEESKSSLQAHGIAHALENILETEFSASVEVHHEPWEPPVKKIKSLIYKIAGRMDNVKEIHKIRPMEKEDGFFISLHLILPKDTSVEKAHIVATDVEKHIKRDILENLGLDMDVQVHMEPCDENCRYCKVKKHPGK